MTTHGSAGGIPFNYRYLISLARQRGGRVLDYGCGLGHAVALGRMQNVDIWGVDTYDNNYTEWLKEMRPEARDYVRHIDLYKADFPDNHFDFIFCNQVLEHVKDPEAVAADIHRVLKPGGIFVGAFPATETWYEGHVGLYFAHRFKPGRLRRLYFDICYRLGIGLYRTDRSRQEWVEMAERTLDDACFYYPRKRLMGLFRNTFGTPPKDIGADYMRVRWAQIKTAPIALDPVLRLIYRLRAGEIIELTKGTPGR